MERLTQIKSISRAERVLLVLVVQQKAVLENFPLVCACI